MVPGIKQLERAALEIRKDLLKLCSKEVIHIGGDLSITDVMTRSEEHTSELQSP